MDFFTELLCFLIGAGLMILLLCSVAYLSGKSRVLLENKQTIVVVSLIEALREICPVGSSKGWMLLPSNGGIPRCWNMNFQFPILLENITIYGSSIIVRSLPQVIMNTISDTSKWGEWEPSSCLHYLCVKQFDDPLLRGDSYMQCDMVIRKGNKTDSHTDPLMYRFQHWYSNNVGWVLFWHSKLLNWWFFVVQPTEEVSGNSQCLLTVIQCINPQLVFPKDLATTLVQRLRNIKDAAEMSSLKIFPFNSLIVPEDQSKDPQPLSMSANENYSLFQRDGFCHSPSSSDSDIPPNAVLKLVPFSNKIHSSLQDIKGFVVALQEIQSSQVLQEKCAAKDILGNGKPGQENNSDDFMMQSSSAKSKAFPSDTCEFVYSQSEISISTGLNQTRLLLSERNEKMCHKQVTDVEKHEMSESERKFSSSSVNEKSSKYYKTEAKNSNDPVSHQKKSVLEPQGNDFTLQKAEYQRKELTDIQVLKHQKKRLSYVEEKDDNLVKEHYPQKIVTNSNRSSSLELLRKQSSINRRSAFLSSVENENGLNSDVKMRSISTPLNLSILPNTFKEETVFDDKAANSEIKQRKDNSGFNKHFMPPRSNDKIYRSTGSILNELGVDNNGSDVESCSPDINDFEILLPRLQISESRLAELRTKGNCNASELQAAVLQVSLMNVFSSPDDQKLSSNGWVYLPSFKGIFLMAKKGSIGSLKTVSYLSQADIPVKIDEAWNTICNPRSRFIYDETVKKVKILEEFPDGQKILHVYHELNSILKKEAVDFCLLHTQRQEDSKYCVSLKSIEYENCPLMNCVSRGTLLSSGWVLEEVPSDCGQCKITHIIQVVVSSPNSMLIDELNYIHPQTLHNLKTYLITRPS